MSELIVLYLYQAKQLRFLVYHFRNKSEVYVLFTA